MKRKYEQEEAEALRQAQFYPPGNAAYATPAQASNMQGLQPVNLFDGTPQVCTLYLTECMNVLK